MGLFSSIGKVLGGASKSSSKSEPWKEAQPYLVDTLEQAGSLFDSGNLAPDNVGLGTVTRQGLSGIAGLARNNAVTDAATTGLTDFLGAPGYAGAESYGSIDPNFGNQAVYESIKDQVLPEVASMFGQGGFVNSTTAQQAASDALGSAMAPYAYDQINRNQQLDINQFNTEQNRAFDQYTTGQQQQLSALGLAPSVNSLQQGDMQNLLGVGQIRDANRAANAADASNEVNAAANLFSQIGALGTTSTSTPSALDTVGKIGQTASSLFALCDRRLKRDIEPAGTWRGVTLYTFRYLWDDVLRIGPMAQEVPERARAKVGDFWVVNLGAI